MKKSIFLLTLILFSGHFLVAQTWDILNKSMAAWDINGSSDLEKAWTSYIGNTLKSNPSGYSISQQTGFVNLTKTYVNATASSALLNSQSVTVQTNTAYTIEFKARINQLNKETYPDVAGTGWELNAISARVNKRTTDLYLGYAADGRGYITLMKEFPALDSERVYIDISRWHVYSFVLSADNLTFDIYIDGELKLEKAPTIYMNSATNILRFGTASERSRCNIDVEWAKMGTGDFYSTSKIASVGLSSDSHVENNPRNISVKVNTVLINDGEKLSVSLVDSEGNTVVEAIEAVVSQNKAETGFTIPATVAKGKYFIKAYVASGKIGDVDIIPVTAEYFIVEPSPITNSILPNVSPVGFIKDIASYQYIGPSKEFISPTLIDTKLSVQDGKFLNNEAPLDRYYLFYSPHENPGGMYLATGPTLDGPWTERNTVIDLNWAKDIEGSNVNTASHISACHVIWNDVYNKYFMYFHGPNTTTHYATSDNLKDWTFGKSILNAQDFGSRGNEASYSKIFEYSVPGLDNKFIMLIMIAESSSSRRVYWAHSKDGIDWTGVRRPLVSADLDYKKVPGTDIKPNYEGSIGNNVAASFFMESNGRYFVFFNGSSGNICVAEIGEAFDMEIHWGEYMKAADVIIDKDDNGNLIALPRVAAPLFITDDAGKWYMFFEAGSRLGANIAYAKEQQLISSLVSPMPKGITTYPSVVSRGERLTVQAAGIDGLSVEIIDLSGNRISSTKINGSFGDVHAPIVPGLYFVKITTSENLIKTTKVIVR
jgi:hypothetical protein